MGMTNGDRLGSADARYDAVIVGAGLAGCALGTLLCRSGKRVLAIDKADLTTKDKLCGGVVTGKSYRLLHQVFGSAAAELPWRCHDRAKVSTPHAELCFEGLSFRTIARQELDRFAVRSFLQSGGDILDRTTCERIDARTGQVQVGGERVAADMLVGADGVLSQVRRSITGRRQASFLTLEAFLPPSEQPLHIRCIDGVKGYAYIMPNESSTILGIADLRAGASLRRSFEQLFGLPSGIAIRGALLPMGNDTLLAAGGAFLVGDAAGLISPITGEGIYYALTSACALAANPTMAAYRRAMAPHIRTIRRDFLLKEIIYNDAMRNATFARYGTSRLLTALVNASLAYLLG